jgi:hypothetical protein
MSQAFLGVDPNRPPPPPLRRVVVDYNRWREDMVLYEALMIEAKMEKAEGELVLPEACQRMTRKRGGPQVRSDRMAGSPELVAGRHILVEARVVTVAISERLNARDVRVLLEDLQRRIMARKAMGIDGGF